MGANNSFARNAAKEALAERGKGNPAITDNVAKSARLILDGKGTDADVQRLREALHWNRSGATAAKKAIGRYTGAMDRFSRVTTQLDVMRASGGGAVSQARVAQVLASEMAGVLKSKHTREIAITVGKAIGANRDQVRAFLGSLRGSLRLAGPIIGGAIMALGVAEEYFVNTPRARAEATLKRYKGWASARTDAKIRQRDAREAAGIVEGEVMPWDYAANYYGLSASMEERLTEEIAKRVERRNVQRTALMNSGQGAKVLERFAAKRGKLVSELTEGERARALDEESELLSPSRLEHDSYVENKLSYDREIWRKRIDWSTRLLPGSGLLREQMYKGLEMELDRRRKGYAEEAAAAYAKTEAGRLNEALKISEQARAKMTPAESWKMRDELDRSRRAFASSRLRHKTWSNN